MSGKWYTWEEDYQLLNKVDGDSLSSLYISGEAHATTILDFLLSPLQLTLRVNYRQLNHRQYTAHAISR